MKAHDSKEITDLKISTPSSVVGILFIDPTIAYVVGPVF
jgi:hypothetical protein